MTNTVRRYNGKTYTEARLKSMKDNLYKWLRARSSNKKMVTSDDVHLFLNNKGVRRNEVYTRLALSNSVLREPYFRSMGQVASNRPSAKGRRITQWVRR